MNAQCPCCGDKWIIDIEFVHASPDEIAQLTANVIADVVCEDCEGDEYESYD